MVLRLFARHSSNREHLGVMGEKEHRDETNPSREIHHLQSKVWQFIYAQEHIQESHCDKTIKLWWRRENAVDIFVGPLSAERGSKRMKLFEELWY